jgi:hypothetical protein
MVLVVPVMDLTFRLYAPASERWGIRPSTTISMKSAPTAARVTRYDLKIRPFRTTRAGFAVAPRGQATN